MLGYDGFANAPRCAREESVMSIISPDRSATPQAADSSASAGAGNASKCPILPHDLSNSHNKPNLESAVQTPKNALQCPIVPPSIADSENEPNPRLSPRQL